MLSCDVTVVKSECDTVEGAEAKQSRDLYSRVVPLLSSSLASNRALPLLWVLFVYYPNDMQSGEGGPSQLASWQN